jgi:glyine---[glycyl-carrier protein] ligase
VTGRIGTSAAQEALWFGQRLAPDRPNNISCPLEISGPVDHNAIAEALRHVICEVRPD